MKTDCFAYSKSKCLALKEIECKECNFYKTKKELEESRNKAIKRIKSLDKLSESRIIDKYYNGRLE